MKKFYLVFIVLVSAPLALAMDAPPPYVEQVAQIRDGAEDVRVDVFDENGNVLFPPRYEEPGIKGGGDKEGEAKEEEAKVVVADDEVSVADYIQNLQYNLLEQATRGKNTFKLLETHFRFLLSANHQKTENGQRILQYLISNAVGNMPDWIFYPILCDRSVSNETRFLLLGNDPKRIEGAWQAFDRIGFIRGGPDGITLTAEGRRDRIALLNCLIGRGVDKDQRIVEDRSLGTFLIKLVKNSSEQNNNKELIEILLGGDAPADISAVDVDGMTALHHAAFSHDFEMVELLLQYRADVNQRNRYKATPLMVAVKNGFGGLGYESSIGKTVEVLLRAGADVCMVDDYGRTALYYAENRLSEAVRPVVPLLREAERGYRDAERKERAERRAELERQQEEEEAKAAIEEVRRFEEQEEKMRLRQLRDQQLREQEEAKQREAGKQIASLRYARETRDQAVRELEAAERRLQNLEVEDAELVEARQVSQAKALEPRLREAREVVGRLRELKDQAEEKLARELARELGQGEEDLDAGRLREQVLQEWAERQERERKEVAARELEEERLRLQRINAEAARQQQEEEAKREAERRRQEDGKRLAEMQQRIAAVRAEEAVRRQQEQKEEEERRRLWQQEREAEAKRAREFADECLERAERQAEQLREQAARQAEVVRQAERLRQEFAARQAVERQERDGRQGGPDEIERIFGNPAEFARRECQEAARQAVRGGQQRDDGGGGGGQLPAQPELSDGSRGSDFSTAAIIAMVVGGCAVTYAVITKYFPDKWQKIKEKWWGSKKIFRADKIDKDEYAVKVVT